MILMDEEIKRVRRQIGDGEWGTKTLLQAEHKATLKAVGESLYKAWDKASMEGYYPEEITTMLDRFTKSLLQGELPE